MPYSARSLNQYSHLSGGNNIGKPSTAFGSSAARGIGDKRAVRNGVGNNHTNRFGGNIHTGGTKSPAGSGLAAARGNKGSTWPGAGNASQNLFRRNTLQTNSSSPYTTTNHNASVASICGSLNSSRRIIPKQKEHHEGKYTVVFDLDETLVSNRTPGFRPAAKRPHLESLLKCLKGKAEVVLWTASVESVGKPVLRQIDPNDEFFDHAIYRSPSWFSERPANPHTKDLRLLGRDMSKTLIVENNPFSVRMNKANAIMVPDFDRPNPTDTTLKKLEGLLQQMIAGEQPVQSFVTGHHTLHPVWGVLWFFLYLKKGLTLSQPATRTGVVFFWGFYEEHQ